MSNLFIYWKLYLIRFNLNYILWKIFIISVIREILNFDEFF